MRDCKRADGRAYYRSAAERKHIDESETTYLRAKGDLVDRNAMH
jgi:hypothetical protein